MKIETKRTVMDWVYAISLFCMIVAVTILLGRIGVKHVQPEASSSRNQATQE